MANMLLMPSRKKRRGPGRPPKYGQTDESGRSGKRVSLDMHPDVRAGIDRYIATYNAEEKIRVGITQVIEKAVIELLERKGLWPPPKRNG